MESSHGFKDYKPISTLGCLHKIIAKLLDHRLQAVMESIIGLTQSSFIIGKKILDGALITEELIDSCKKKESQGNNLETGRPQGIWLCFLEIFGMNYWANGFPATMVKLD